MIIKEVENPKRSSSKAVRISALSDYIVAPQNTNALEKCIYNGARGFIFEGQANRVAEMIATAQESIRCKDPVNHYVFSFHDDEPQPTPKQVEEMVTIFLETLGLTGCQVIYGLHADTDNFHVHLEVNRVDPDTLKVREINKGFDREAIHQAIAIIEHAQGWKRQEKGRYRLSNGELHRTDVDTDKPKQPGQRQRDMENRTGQKSAQRLAIERCEDILRTATNWGELHLLLAKNGMRYERAGSGAKIWVGDIPVKASDVWYAGSLLKMQNRLGTFEPAAEALKKTVEHVSEPVNRDTPGWDAYISARTSHYAAKETANLLMRKRHASEFTALAAAQKQHRDRLLNGSWKGKGDLRNALLSAIALNQAAEKATLKARHRTEREQLRGELGAPPQDFEQWLRRQGRPEDAEKWRHRSNPNWRPHRLDDDLDQAESEPNNHIEHVAGGVVGVQIREWIDNLITSSATPAGTQYTWQNGHPACLDRGNKIDMCENVTSARADLMLDLIVSKGWASVRLDGTDEFKQVMAAKLRAAGITITNPEFRTPQQSQVMEAERTYSEMKRRLGIEHETSRAAGDLRAVRQGKSEPTRTEPQLSGPTPETRSPAPKRPGRRG